MRDVELWTMMTMTVADPAALQRRRLVASEVELAQCDVMDSAAKMLCHTTQTQRDNTDYYHYTHLMASFPGQPG